MDNSDVENLAMKAVAIIDENRDNPSFWLEWLDRECKGDLWNRVYRRAQQLIAEKHGWPYELD